MKITPNKSGFDRLFLYSFVAISFLINNWTSERLFIPYKKQKVCLNLKVWGEFSRRSQMHSQAGWRMWSLQLDVGVLRPPLWKPPEKSWGWLHILQLWISESQEHLYSNCRSSRLWNWSEDFISMALLSCFVIKLIVWTKKHLLVSCSTHTNY